MPQRKTVEAFVAQVEKGDFVGAIERWYAPDATMRENGAAPRVGRPVLVENERRVMASFPSIRASLIGPVLIDGDSVAIPWRFEFARDGAVRTLEEVALQTWRGDSIAEERFFYDPSQLTG
jgi:SnoaL-like domain